MAVGWLCKRREAWGAAPAAHIPARSREARAAPALTPVTFASVACLPTHVGLPETLPLCLASPKPRGQELGASHRSGGCKELSDELQHARAHGAHRLLPGPRVMVEGVWALLCLCVWVSRCVLYISGSCMFAHNICVYIDMCLCVSLLWIWICVCGYRCVLKYLYKVCCL